MAGGLLPVVVLATWLAGESAQPAPTSVRVLYDGSPVWQQPDVTGPRLATLDRGTILALDRRQGDWYAVFLPAASSDDVARRGYVLASAVEFAGASAPSSVPDASRQAGAPPPLVPPGRVFEPPEPTDFPREGLYVGYGYALSRHDAGGDFDGDHFVYYQGAVSVLPALAQGSGLDLTLGYRRSRSAIEVRYRRTRHDAGWAGLSGSAVYHTLDASWKVFVLPQDRVQPYLSFDIGLPWLSVEDGLLPSGRGATRNAQFTGIGGAVGGGLTVFANPRLGLWLGGAYRYDVYLSNKSEDGSWIEIEDLVSGRGLRFTGGVTFTF